MKKSFYLINDPTQNVPEGDKIWVEQLKQKKIMCGRCWGIIENHQHSSALACSHASMICLYSFP